MQSEVESKVKGIALNASVSVSDTSSEIVNTLTSNTNIKMIQSNINSVMQSMQNDLEAGRDVNMSDVSMSAIVDQIIES